MKKVKLLLFLSLIFLSFDKVRDGIRLIFQEEKGMRSSFCMYSDGKFYETRPSGCVGQFFTSGNWKNTNDTITLMYQIDNVFDFDIIKSADTTNEYQFIRIIDCYNQPVRFQNICFDTTCLNLYNPGILRLKKGKSIFYSAPHFEQNNKSDESLLCSADTVTYKWHCNRESLESINGGSLFVNKESMNKNIILKNKTIISLPE